MTDLLELMATLTKIIDTLGASDLPAFYKNLWEPLLILLRDLISKAGGVSKLGAAADGLLSSSLSNISLFLELFHTNESVS